MNDGTEMQAAKVTGSKIKSLEFKSHTNNKYNTEGKYMF